MAEDLPGVIAILRSTYSLLRELGIVAGATSLSYATYGLYTSMKEIRQKVG